MKDLRLSLFNSGVKVLVFAHQLWQIHHFNNRICQLFVLVCVVFSQVVLQIIKSRATIGWFVDFQTSYFGWFLMGGFNVFRLGRLCAHLPIHN